MRKIWNKLFNKKNIQENSDEDTIPIQQSSKKNQVNATGESSSLHPIIDFNTNEKYLRSCIEPHQLQASCSQSIGNQRDNNEDAMFCLTTMFSSNGRTTPFGLYIVADGMGGHEYGEIASEIATQTLAKFVISKLFSSVIGTDKKPTVDLVKKILNDAVFKAHEEIKHAISDGGTTLSAVTIFNNQMTITHVGDSRIYYIDLNGNITALTRDHTLVRRLQELGQLTSEEAKIDPRRNVLYHALGQDSFIEPEIISTPIPKSGYILVCSDGLWGILSDEIMRKIVLTSDNLANSCQNLVNAANEAGGADNITAILIRLPLRTNA